MVTRGREDGAVKGWSRWREQRKRSTSPNPVNKIRARAVPLVPATGPARRTRLRPL